MQVNAAGVALFALRTELLPKAARDALGIVTAEEAREQARLARHAAAKPAAEIAAAARPPPTLWSQLETDDLRTPPARLRAAGFSTVVIRAVIDAQIAARFEARLRAITHERDQTPYWRQPPYFFSDSKSLEAITQVYRERARLLRDLLGTDALAHGESCDVSAAQRRRYGDLPPSKIDLVSRISDDYADMIGQVRAAMQGVTLPEDREKLAFLERERRADLAAILTPAELADYELRSSPVSNRLRTTLTILDASEAEFRVIHAVQQPYAEILNPTGGLSAFRMVEERGEATQRINEQLKRALSAERFAEYQRASNFDYQNLHRLAQGENIPAANLTRVYEARLAAAENSARIANDPALTPAQRLAAQQALADTARTTILSNLGPRVGPAYAQTANWLAHLAQGGSVSILPDGNLAYRYPASPTPPKK